MIPANHTQSHTHLKKELYQNYSLYMDSKRIWLLGGNNLALKIYSRMEIFDGLP